MHNRYIYNIMYELVYYLRARTIHNLLQKCMSEGSSYTTGCFSGFSTLRLVARGDLEATKALTGRGGRTGRDEMRKAP